MPEPGVRSRRRKIADAETGGAKSAAKTPAPFWRRKRLGEMTAQEWESLCDGCGKCCLHKMEDIDSGRITNTDIACRYLDPQTCRCSDYENRLANVHNCIQLTPNKVRHLDWLPASCAYRLVEAGEDLPPWHHLICSDREAIHREGMSVRGRTTSEDDIGDMKAYIARTGRIVVER